MEFDCFSTGNESADADASVKSKNARIGARFNSYLGRLFIANKINKNYKHNKCRIGYLPSIGRISS